MAEEFENKKGTSNYMEVVDEEDIETLKAQIEAVNSELEAFEEKRLDAVKLKERYETQWAVDKEEMTLQLEHFGMPEEKYTHKIHFVPRFWELQKKKFEFKVEEQTKQAESWIDGQTRIIEEFDNSILTIKKQQEELKKQLEEVEKND